MHFAARSELARFACCCIFVEASSLTQQSRCLQKFASCKSSGVPHQYQAQLSIVVLLFLVVNGSSGSVAARNRIFWKRPMSAVVLAAVC